MTTTMEQIAAADTAALDEYRSLLRRNNDPLPDDPARLKAVAAQLGFSPADVQADAVAMGTTHRLEKAVAEIPELDRERIEAGKALADYGDATRRIEYDRSVRQGELDLESARIEIRLRRLREQRGQLVVHRRKYPRLFDEPAAAAPPPEMTNLIGAPHPVNVLDD